MRKYRRKIVAISTLMMISLAGCASATTESTSYVESAEAIDSTEIMESTEIEIETEVQETIDQDKVSTEAEILSTVPETEYANDLDYIVTFTALLDDEDKDFANKKVADTNVQKYQNYLDDLLKSMLNSKGIIKDTKKADVSLFDNNQYERVLRYESYESVVKQDDNFWRGRRYLEDGKETQIEVESGDTNGFGYYFNLYGAEFEVIGGDIDNIVCAYIDGQGSGYITFNIKDDTIVGVKIENGDSFNDTKPSVTEYSVDLEGSEEYNENLNKFNLYKKGIDIPVEG